MSWAEVPAKLIKYAQEPYAKLDAVEVLLAEYKVALYDDVPEHRRADFESDLDYRLNACVNLRNSRALRRDRNVI